ncbi:hypothetical protein SISNIDRAFT_486723 [Sistotremastrum niveocremeum HHB9708]|uniref:DUF6699 domain-containing protein n=1 Tax=Sistotremastrum niveocremeum HHB9708 TaxID=1314777 RepID=A0A164T9T6_9AGAM|nr:hypothetical protein SISNIDRAFT_486723 [Sistotremastrum niveocremeum HHB9708]
MSSRSAAVTPPPSYESAIAYGILARTGTTPFPDAPQLRTLMLPTPSPESPTVGLHPLPAPATSVKKPHRSSRVTSTKDVEMAGSSSKHRKHDIKHDIKSNGWFSDTSNLRSSRDKSSDLKKSILKATVRSPASSSTTEPESQAHWLLGYNARHKYLQCDLSLPETHMRCFTDRSSTIPPDVLKEHATSPPTRVLHIVCDDFAWPIKVTNVNGVTCNDVLDAVRNVLSLNVTGDEWKRIISPAREAVKAAFARRCRSSHALEEWEKRQGLRRVDFLCDKTIWDGLYPKPGKPGVWILALRRQ